MERVPTFALMSVRLDGLYQSVVWHGASAAAKLLGVRLVALVGCAFEDPLQGGGPSEIYKLAKRGGFDGYLPMVGSMGNCTGPERVHRFLEALPPRPTVCIGLGLPGYASVISDGNGIEAVVRHLAQAHGLREMAYLSGSPMNPDAIRRKADFIRTCEELRIHYHENWLEETDFSIKHGRLAMARILDSGRIPPAVVCANDASALGARQELASRGLRTPEDVIVTGFDDIEEARTMVPALTTVASATYQVAFRSVELLLELLGGAPPRKETLPTELVVRRSCGCRVGSATAIIPRLQRESSGAPDPDSLYGMLCDPISSQLYLRQLEAVMDQADSAKIDHWEEVLHIASRRIAQRQGFTALVSAQTMISQARHGLDIRHRQSLQQSMLDQFAAVQDMVTASPGDDYPEKILEALSPFADNELRLLLFNADLSPLIVPDFDDAQFEMVIDAAQGRIERGFAPDLFFPGEAKAGNWAFLPLVMGDEHYGIVQVLDWVSNEIALESLRISLSIALSSARKSANEARAREELARLARRDDMTGLLNRRGLLEQAGVLVQSAVRSGARIGVVLCDLDGLKAINDRWGHPDGDLAIQCLAKALEDGFRQSDLVARLGGDEFAVVTLMEVDGCLDGAMERTRSALERRSLELRRPWSARTSAGWMIWDPSDGECLDSALARADEHLYSDKRARKSVGSGMS